MAIGGSVLISGGSVSGGPATLVLVESLRYSIALSAPALRPGTSKYGMDLATAIVSWPPEVPSTPSIPGHIRRLAMTAVGPSTTTVVRHALYSSSTSSPLHTVTCTWIGGA